MHELGWLRDLVVLFGLAIVVVVLCHRIKIPTLIGFLLAGVLAGPSVLGLIHNRESVEILAEIGVVLLLFSIGIEFSLENLLRIRSLVLVGGGLQVFITAAAVAGGALLAFERSPGTSILLGLLVALSSTAIVMKLLAERAEVESPQGRIKLGILIFQDICVVPMMVLLPFLAGKGASLEETLEILGKAALLVVVLLLLGRYLVPWILEQVVRTRSREVFLLVVIILCLGTAWVSSLAGLSLALGAFVAGLIMSQSTYSHQALGEILPFREVFMSLFLISIGLLLDLSVFHEPLVIAVGVLGIIGLKAAIVLAIALFLRYPFRIALIAGLGLAQVGEFSFVLAQAGFREGILDERTYERFLAAAVITMMLTPLLKGAAAPVAERLSGILPRRLVAPWHPELSNSAPDLNGHVVIVGYGVNGRNLASVLRRVELPYIVIEMNPETVSTERKKGEPIVYGDASTPEILRFARVSAARVLVIAVSDPAAIRRTVFLARSLHPALHIIVRTRFVGEVKPLIDLGADEVIPEEFETSLEIFSRTLRHMLVPRDVVERFVREARQNEYGLLRAGTSEGEGGEAAMGPTMGAEIEVFRVEEGAPVAGKTLEASALRKDSGATVLALRRGDRFVCNPAHEERLDPGTVAIVFGTPEQVAAAAKAFRRPDATRS